MSATPIPDSYWVIDGLLLAGEYPASQTAEQARAKLQRFLDAGIRAFFDLTEEGELGSYEGLLIDIAREHHIDATYDRTPIRDVDVPEPWELKRLLAKISVKVNARIPSYVHCWGGVGRTGTVIGCWLVEHAGLDGEMALRRLAEIRSHTPKAGRTSPETTRQCMLVRQWSEHAKEERDTSEAR